MKSNDKELFDNPLAETKPRREGPSFVERKKEAFKNLWTAIKDGINEWGIGVVPPPPPRGGLSGLDRLRPGTPMPPVKKPKGEKCEKCGTTDCISSEEYRKRLDYSGRTTNSKFLLKSCSVRQQLNAMGKLRVRTSSGKEVFLTQHGRIEDQTFTEEQVEDAFEELIPPKPEMPPNETIGGYKRPKRPPPPPNPPPPRRVGGGKDQHREAIMKAKQDIADAKNKAMRALEAKQDEMTKILADKERELGERLSEEFNTRRGRKKVKSVRRIRPPVR